MFSRHDWNCGRPFPVVAATGRLLGPTWLFGATQFEVSVGNNSVCFVCHGYLFITPEDNHIKPHIRHKHNQK